MRIQGSSSIASLYGTTGKVQRQETVGQFSNFMDKAKISEPDISKHASRLSSIQGKLKETGFESLSSDEVDYLQKAGGFVNTMSYLSSKERALYDEMVAKGEGKAASALLLVGMSRIGMEGNTVTLPNGKSFDVTNTEVNSYSIRNLYKYMFVDPSGKNDQQFEALASYLDKQGSTSQT